MRTSIYPSLPLINVPLFERHTTRDLHLREAPVNKQFCARDVTGIVRSQKNYCLRNLIRCTKPAERDTRVNHLNSFLSGVPGSKQIIQSGSIDRAGTDCVDANPALF